MPKYRNVKSFIQLVRKEGQRILIKPGEVYESDKELDLTIYTFLQKVADNEAVTVQPPKPIVKKPTPATLDEVSSLRKTVDDLQNSLKSFPLHKDLEVFATKDDVAKSLQETKDKILEETPTVEPEEIAGLHQKIIALSDFYRQLKEDQTLMIKLTAIEKDVALCLKRLDIMKNAVEVMNQAVHNIEVEVYENSEHFIIEDDEPHTN